MSFLVPDRRILDKDGNPIHSRRAAEAASSRIPALPDPEDSAFVSGQLLRAFERGELPDAQPDDLPLFRSDVCRWMHPALASFWDGYAQAPAHVREWLQDVTAEALDRLGLLPNHTHHDHRRDRLLGTSSHAAMSLAYLSRSASA